MTDRQTTERPKTGVNLGVVAINPVNGEELPVYAADYVLADYGTGAIMSVPAHDQRDLDFARTFGLAVRTVIDVPGTENPEETYVATTGKVWGSSSPENSKFGTAGSATMVVSGNEVQTITTGATSMKVTRRRRVGIAPTIIGIVDATASVKDERR